MLFRSSPKMWRQKKKRKEKMRTVKNIAENIEVFFLRKRVYFNCVLLNIEKETLDFYMMIIIITFSFIVKNNTTIHTITYLNIEEGNIVLLIIKCYSIQ